MQVNLVELLLSSKTFIKYRREKKQLFFFYKSIFSREKDKKTHSHNVKGNTVDLHIIWTNPNSIY